MKILNKKYETKDGYTTGAVIEALSRIETEKEIEDLVDDLLYDERNGFTSRKEVYHFLILYIKDAAIAFIIRKVKGGEKQWH